MKQRITQNFLALVAVLFILWILLTGSISYQELLTGLIVAIAVALVSNRSTLMEPLILSRSALISLFKYLYFFFIALVKANLDLARRILTPSLPIHPAVVEIQTELESDLGRLLLANSITLTPGTLTIDVQQNRLLVHWVDASHADDIQATTQAIAGQFEQHIRGFLK